MMTAIKLIGLLVFIIVISAIILNIGLIIPGRDISRADIEDIISDKYPDSDADIEYLEECTVCDSSGCATYPSPCWRITVIIRGDEGSSIVDMIMDSSGGEQDSRTSPCTEWWCDADPCRYTYSEEDGGITTEYTNRDCGSSVCDQEHERCRDCQAGFECIATVTTTGSGVVAYRFEVLGTGEHAGIDGTEKVCRIYSRGAMIFSEPMEVEECGSLMKDNTECFEGSCDFVPGFALIQS